MHTLQRLLTTPTAANAGSALAESFRSVAVLLFALGILAGMAHGPWAAELAIAILLAIGLVAAVTGLLYLAWRIAFGAAWRAVVRR